MVSNFIGIAELSWVYQALAVPISILGLWAGAEAATRAASALARRIGVSQLVIGLTLVSIASSLPEIFVNVSAVLAGEDNLAAGNVVGSCFVQISLVLGLCAVIGGPLPLSRRELWRDGTMVVIANLTMIAFAANGHVSMLEGALLLAAYATYLGYVVYTAAEENGADARTGRKQTSDGSSSNFNIGDEASDTVALSRGSLPLGLGVLLSVLLVWLMADILVAVGKNAGEAAGLPAGAIGLWVGVGTTFPELVISLTAVLRGASSLSIGNLLGSNITDPFLSLGAGVLAAAGLTVSGFVLAAALVWLATTVLAVTFFAVDGALIPSRGFLLMVAYVVGQSSLLLL